MQGILQSELDRGVWGIFANPGVGEIRPSPSPHQIRLLPRTSNLDLAIETAIPAPPAQRPGPSIGQYTTKRFKRNRFGDVVVHLRLQAALAIALQRRGCHGDDRCPAIATLKFADFHRCLKAVDLGHLAIHQHGSVGKLAARVHRLPAVAHHLDFVPQAPNQSPRDLLVHGVVLGNRMFPRDALGPQTLTPDGDVRPAKGVVAVSDRNALSKARRSCR